MYSFGSSSRYSAYLRKAEAIFMGSALHHFGSREMLLQHLHECKVGGDKTYMPGGNQMAVARSSLLITSSPRRPAHLSGPRSAEPWCLPPDRQNCQAISGLESEIPAARRKLWPICIQGGGGGIFVANWDDSHPFPVGSCPFRWPMCNGCVSIHNSLTSLIQTLLHGGFELLDFHAVVYRI